MYPVILTSLHWLVKNPVYNNGLPAARRDRNTAQLPILLVEHLTKHRGFFLGRNVPQLDKSTVGLQVTEVPDRATLDRTHRQQQPRQEIRKMRNKEKKTRKRLDTFHAYTEG